MNLNASDHRFGYSAFKWSLFSVELFLLSLLLIIAFLVPVPPFRWGKMPQEALLVALSVMVAIPSAMLFRRSAENSPVSLGSLISTPPSVVAITVIAIVVIPLAIGLVWR